MAFALLPPIRLARGGRLWPRHPFRWKRRVYRLSDWPRVLYRLRTAIPSAVLVLILFGCEPANRATVCTVLGLGVWAAWLALRFTSQRGEIDILWLPLQGIPLAFLLLCLMFVSEPQMAADWTRIPARRLAGSPLDKRQGIEVLGLRFGPIKNSSYVTQVYAPAPPKPDLETESDWELYVRQQQRQQYMRDRFQREGH
jgi:hypothetical protein